MFVHWTIYLRKWTAWTARSRFEYSGFHLGSRIYAITTSYLWLLRCDKRLITNSCSFISRVLRYSPTVTSFFKQSLGWFILSYGSILWKGPRNQSNRERNLDLNWDEKLRRSWGFTSAKFGQISSSLKGLKCCKIIKERSSVLLKSCQGWIFFIARRLEANEIKWACERSKNK